MSDFLCVAYTFKMGSKVILFLTVLVLDFSLISGASVNLLSNVSNATHYSGSDNLSTRYSSSDNLSSQYSGSNLSYQTMNAQPAAIHPTMPIPMPMPVQPRFSLVSAIVGFVSGLVNKTLQLLTEAFVKMSYCLFNKLRSSYPSWSGMCY